MYKISADIIAAQLGQGGARLIESGKLEPVGKSVNGVPLFDKDEAAALLATEPEPITAGDDADIVATADAAEQQYQAFLSISADAYASDLPAEQIPYSDAEVNELLFLAGKTPQEAVDAIRDLGEARIGYRQLVAMMADDPFGIPFDDDDCEVIIANAQKTTDEFFTDVEQVQRADAQEVFRHYRKVSA